MPGRDFGDALRRITRRGRQPRLWIAVAGFILVVGVGSALASSQAEEAEAFGLATPADVLAAIEAGNSIDEPMLTHPAAADELPHQNLDRAQAVDLMQRVFSPVLQQADGGFDELEVDRYLSPTTALVPEDEEQSTAEQPGSEASSPEPNGEVGDELTTAERKRLVDEGKPPSASDVGARISADEIPASMGEAALLRSTLPLRAEDSDGELRPVNLSLSQVEGRLEPANPLAEVALPEELGDGVELGDAGVQVSVAGAPADRTPSTVGGTVAFYPNVAPDTDFAAAPTPTGVETFFQLRSADAPRSQTLELDLPNGAALQRTEDGGARVLSGEEALVGVAPPAAIDADGESVPVELEVSGDSLVLTVSPDASASYPILVDPLIQTYEWMKEGTKSWQDGICNSSFEFHSSNPCNYREEWGIEGVYGGPASGGMEAKSEFWGTAPLYVKQGTPGLFVRSSGEIHSGSQLSWIYTVPRYFTDQEKYGSRPTSFISKMKLSNVLWQAFSSHSSPYVYLGLWSPNKAEWVSYYSHEGATEHGLNNMSYVYEFNGGTFDSNHNFNQNTDTKVAYVGIRATETQPTQNTDLYVGSATVELEDKESPTVIANGPSGWVNQAVVPLTFTATDTGLGASAISASTEQLGTDGKPLHTWKASYGCLGLADAACPRQWKSSESGHPALNVEPALLPSGEDFLNVVAEDPVGNKSAAAWARLRVDHGAPTVSISGTATEQAALGTKRPSYTVKANATDGTANAPQSGVAKLAIQFDGTTVKQTEPGCSTENCSLGLEWTIEASKYGAGEHSIKVTATDAVGISTVEERKITLNPSPPELSLSGTMTEQASLGTTRPRYRLSVNAASVAGEPGVVSAPTYLSSFGSSGAGSGQLAHPGDVAIDSSGNLWVADVNNNRLEVFNGKGEFVKTFGSPGSGSGQFTRPKSIAFAADGSFWVADAGNNRLQKFSAAGAFVKAVGTAGSGNGQFSGPEGIAIDAKGNIWVSDTYNYRVQELNAAGEFIKVVNPSGLGAIEPTGIDAGPGGNVWVADWAHNRVVELSEAGGLVRSFGTQGTGNGQFNQPDAITIDGAGTVWVGDQNNGRIQGFNQAGEYLTKFGSAGSGSGQFSFSYPFGMAADSQGNLWVADANNNRVQKWAIPGMAPAYSSSVGSAGSGNGQFSMPAGAATGAEGHLFAADSGNNRIEEFNGAGEFVRTFGNGQLSYPTAVAVGPSGHLWVADAGNARIAEFNEEGQLVRSFRGSGANELAEPYGVAVDPAGDVWVTDTWANRIEEFSTKGEWIGTFKGSGNLFYPTGIAAGPDGRIWIADAFTNSVEKLSPSGAYEGKLAAPAGGFNYPSAVTVDESGELWVTEAGAGRVDRFGPNGSYVGQFGAQGSSAGQFNFEFFGGLAVDAHGNIWVADTNNNRVQKWKVRGRAAEVTIEVFLDGKRVQAATTGCTVEHCPIAKEWTLESPGNESSHTVLARATDGLGNTTSKSLSISIQKDTTKPAIEAGGSLIAAPEGWVEQEGYGVNVYAKDSGYGATSLELKIDGKQVAATSPSSCPDGGCEAHLQQTIDMAPYEGGAHQAELLAKDGAGNTEVQDWTVNVDPEGHVTANELNATLAAAEATGSPTTVGASGETPEFEGNSPNLSLVEEDGGIYVEGGQVPTELSTAAEGGLSFEVPEESAFDDSCSSEETNWTEEGEGRPEIEEAGQEDEPCEPYSADPEPEWEEPSELTSALEPASVRPQGDQDVGSQSVTSNGAAALAPNAGLSADTVTRPLYDGALIFKAIRDAAAPTEYTWEVNLQEGQTLHLIDPSHVEVDYAGGHPAFQINAEEAHDAVGTGVPTHLTVGPGNLLNLIVDHRGGGYVYPVVAGAGWQGGFVSTVAQGPQDEAELREEKERIEAEERQRREEAEEAGEQYEEVGVNLEPLSASAYLIERGVVGPPLYARRSDGSTVVHRRFKFTKCMHKHGALPNEPPETGGNPPWVPGEQERVNNYGVQCEEADTGGGIYWAVATYGYYSFENEWVWLNRDTVHCNRIWGPESKERHIQERACFERNEGGIPHRWIGQNLALKGGPVNLIGEFRFGREHGHFGFSGYTCMEFEGSVYPYAGHWPRRGPINTTYAFEREPFDQCPNEGLYSF